MNRIEFMRQLESLLQNISPTEREEALQYYNDYFNDAGPESEQDVIEALGNPAKVAENIKRDLYGSGYGDNVYQRNADKAVIQYQSTAAEAKKENNKMSTGMVVLIVILCVLASPIILSVGAAIVSVLFGLLAAAISTIVGFGAAALVLFVVTVMLLVVGIMCIFYSPLTGVALIGGGLVCGGLSLLFLMLVVAIAGILLPAMCRGIGSLWHNISGKKETV